MATATTDRRLGLAGGTAYKVPATVLSTGNITQSGEQTIDGIAVLASNAAGRPDRVLCTGMTDATKNGLWDVQTSAWTRSIDANGNYDWAQGTQILIGRGTAALQVWVLTTLAPITVGTTSMTFAQSLPLASLALSTGATLIGWIRTATNAIATTLARWMGWQAVEAFEFMTAAQVADVQAGTLALDVTAALQSWMNAVVAAGRGHLAAGSYLISGDITANADSVNIFGDGPRRSILVSNSATAGGLVFGDGITTRNGITIRDLGTNQSTPRTSGTSIKFNKVNQLLLKNFWQGAPFKGVEILDSTIVMVETGQIVNPTAATGIGIDIGGTTGNDQYIRDIIVTGNSGAQPLAGVRVRQTGGLWMDNVGAIWSGDGLVMDPQNGQAVLNVFTSRCSWDTNTRNGASIAPAAGGQVRRWTSSGDWFSTNTLAGFTTGGAGSVSGVTFNGPRAYNNGTHGMAFTSIANGISINAPRISGNSVTAANTSDGINFAATVSNWEVIGGKVGQQDGFTNIQRWGIFVGVGASDAYSIRGVDVNLNTTGAISDGGTGTNKYIQGNPGFRTNNSGGATIGIGASTVVVTHSLDATPSINDINLTPLSNLGASSITYFWVSAVSATTFTISVNANVAAVGINFAWSARVKGA